MNHPCAERCQFAVDVGMTDHSCSPRCQYECAECCKPMQAYEQAFYGTLCETCRELTDL